MKKDNKGFSLVELIVVVAIMAVLMTVLAPSLLRYVERTRLQKDNSAIAEIANAVKIAMANETINSAVPTGSTVTIQNGADTDAVVTFADDVDDAAGTDIPALEAELEAVIGATYTTSSNTYNAAADDIVLTITKTGDVTTVTATGFIAEVGAAAASHTF